MSTFVPTSPARNHGLLRPVVYALIATVMVVLPAKSAFSKGDDAKKAAILAEQAMKFHFGGKPELAIALYQQAYKLDPKAGYVYSAGRAAHKAKKWAQARKAYQQVIATTQPETPFHIKATARLAELPKVKKKSKSAQATAQPPDAKDSPQPTSSKEPAPKPQTPSPPKPVIKPVAIPKPVTAAVAPVAPPTVKTAWRTPAGWGAVGAGVLALGGAAALWSGAAAQSDRLDSYKLDDKTYDSRKITPAELQAEERSHNTKIVSAWGLGLVGGVAAIVGARWLMMDGPDVSLVPTVAPGLASVSVAVPW